MARDIFCTGIAGFAIGYTVASVLVFTMRIAGVL